MHNYKNFVVIFLMNFVWLIAVDIQLSYACSGGAPLTIEGLLDASNFLVKAHIIEQDDAHQNSIIQVEAYLAGATGPEYILFKRIDPIYTGYVSAGRSTGGDCLGFSPELHRTDMFYVFLSRNDDGSYSGCYNLIQRSNLSISRI